ncbi:MAG: hypothetical protein GF416_06285 [Candidatus Altiarchaeales archaeon]|nr:hypothetical protein [Candidatus Altiarchaeales archaeon]MBD3416724.1 hypothetical protein [Candidatus Altiarchaeales archaeon]
MVCGFFHDRRRTIFLFSISTAFFLYQHMIGLSWDFSVYVLNARYMFGGGHYMEWLRAPLMPFLLFTLSFAGYRLGEYLYIVLASMLFAVASVKFAGKAGLDGNIFYALMLSPYVLNWGLLAGTELLTLSLLMLALTYLKTWRSCVFFGLGVLARYTTVSYLVLLAYKRNVKDVILCLAVLVLVFTPWMAYNKALKGHPLYSVGDSMFFNMVYRRQYATEFSLWHVAGVIGAYLPFMAYGLCACLRRRLPGYEGLVLAFMILALISYWRIPVKEIRHLFNLSLPAAYFTAVALKRLEPSVGRELVLASIVLLNFSMGTLTFESIGLWPGFYEGAEAVRGDCMVMSNMWPQLNYLGVRAETYPERVEVRAEIGEGKRIILYKYGPESEPEYMHDVDFMGGLPTIDETYSYVILGEIGRCAPQEDVDGSMMELLDNRGYDAELCPLLPLMCG